MKHTVKLLLFALVPALLLPSCNAKDDASVLATTAAPDTTLQSSTDRLVADVPVKDYEGYVFRLLGGNESYNEHWHSRDLDAEEVTGESINDAVYNRNSEIEEKYNIEIKGILSATPMQDAQKSINAGSDEYDVVSVSMQNCLISLIQKNMMYDLNSLPYLDLDKPWWDSHANSQLSVAGKLYGTVSDLLVMDKDAVFIMLFNKDMIADYQLENPYELVRSGKWTADKLYEMSKTVSEDVNGDGKMDDADKYGFVSQTHTMHGLVTGAGLYITGKDKNDIPYFTINTPQVIKTFEKWMNIHMDRSNVIIAQDYEKKYPGNEIWDFQLDLLNEKRGLFLYTGMNRVTMLRGMDCNFGILPVPKIDEGQEQYANAVHMWCASSIAIPVTVADTDRTSIILEALTAESYYTLRPAYYDITLKNKLTRDNESSEMLDLIFSTRSYDLGSMYNWGNFHYIFGDLALKGSFELVSTYEKKEAAAQKELEKTLDILK
ncbi:MAG: hypothetical protein AB9835_11235 [Eubacteriales bacterium]